MTLLVRTSRTRKRMPSTMTIWSQRNRRNRNFSKFLGISDIRSPENWPELCATQELNVTLSGGFCGS
eukprot:4886565-Karenia_brevis.AAC.1